MTTRVAQNTKGLSDTQKLAKLQTNIDKATANPKAASCKPTVTAMQGDHDAADALVKQVASKKLELAALVLQKDAAVQKAMDTRAQFAAWVENNISDPADVAGLGFELVGQASPTQPVAKIENNVLSTGDNAGDADGVWDSDPNAKAYKVEITDDPTKEENWKPYDTVTTSFIHLHKLPSGKKTWTRVCGINKLGPGSWSDPACAMVP